MSLASLARGGAFTKVVENIATLTDELKKTRAEDERQKNECVAELKQNGKETNQKERMKADLETQLADLADTIKTLGEEIATAKAAVLDAQVEMKKASENREQENQDFRVTVQDQRATQTILNKATERLKVFYEKKGLLQVDQPAQKEYKKSG